VSASGINLPVQTQPAVNPDEKPETIPTLAEFFDLNPKVLRRAAHSGALRVFDLGTGWRRSTRAEVRRWIRSTQVAPTDHARQRLEEVLRQRST